MQKWGYWPSSVLESFIRLHRSCDISNAVGVDILGERALGRCSFYRSLAGSYTSIAICKWKFQVRGANINLSYCGVTGTMASTWETGGRQPFVTVNNSGLDLVNGLTTGSTKLKKSFDITEGEVEAIYNKGGASKQPSFVDVVIGSINQVVPMQKTVVGRINYTGNYGHFARVLVDVDLVGFVPKKLLLKTTDNCIEVDLYFESFLEFCKFCHSVGHSMVKCKSVIGKALPKASYPKVGAQTTEKENKAPGLTHVYKSKQTHSLHVDSADINTEMGIEVQSPAPSLNDAPSRIDFNTEMGKSIRITSGKVRQHDAVPSSMPGINKEMSIAARPSSPDLGAAPSRIDFDTEVGKNVRITSENVRILSLYSTIPHQVISWAYAFGELDNEIDDYEDDRFEDEWLALQG
ncbi:hypothetical protein FNV43_RR26538 [Rhamnella rubrinervis]|uniref:Zinc knuckle CX2CX4HX4C domain-containing protein n=1 Tax=Rhamnella rubrinervis TaxID=2594499 RepID=A0A8K0GJQ9_9ROSA|nr:hypothetical protein FNV43_RR26538 [Rhamnella rubrinervis]